MIELKKEDLIGKIHLGDCVEFMKSLKGKLFDVSFTSPPYNRIRNDTYAKFDDISNDYYKLLCDVTENLLRLTKGNVIINVQANLFNKVDVAKWQGKFADEDRWISREEFFALKDKEPYIKYIWSFGNNGRDYLYSKAIEPFKRACHYAVFFGDYEPAVGLGINLTAKQEKEYKGERNNTRLQNIQALESLKRLQYIQNTQNLEYSFKDFEEVEIKENSVIYCDPPYLGTDSYEKGKGNNFDYERFYKWCERQKEFCIISEYFMPEDRFVCIGGIEKSVLLASGGDLKTIEKLFIPKHQEQMYRKWKVEEGGFLFDFL